MKVADLRGPLVERVAGTVGNVVTRNQVHGSRQPERPGPDQCESSTRSGTRFATLGVPQPVASSQPGVAL